MPIIGITMGDPAGIGPEVIVKALSRPEIYQWCRPLVIGDAACLEKSAKECRISVTINDLDQVEKAHFQPGVIDVLNLANVNHVQLQPGQASAMAGRASVEYIKTATALALNQEISAITTAPINKEAINAAGFLFAGHTQLLAELSRATHYVMMLASEKLKVSLVTTHLPLAKVVSSLSTEKVLHTIRSTHQGMQENFGLQNPKLALCALNRHAGDGGLFGHEEKEILTPAVIAGIDEGISISGPYPADSLFVRAINGEFDAVIALYHDQGLIPIKLLSFGRAVNLTLGLPIIRTSVDHGTAFDLAGKNKADDSSLIKALQMAAQIVEVKQRRTTGGL